MLIQFVVVFLLMTGLAVVVFALLFGDFGAGLVLGAAMASALMFWFVFTDLLDPVGSRTVAGLTGEELTATELKRLERSGWRAVHNLHFAAGDVDHVAIGPGGVFAIETKTSSCDWPFIERHGTHFVWARQAKQGSERVRHLVKQHCGIDVPVAALVVPWIREQPDTPSELIDGVTRVGGRSLSEHLRSKVSTLDAVTVDLITATLDRVGGEFDRSAGVVRDSLLSRMLRLGR